MLRSIYYKNQGLSSKNQINSSCSSVCILQLCTAQAQQLRKTGVDEELQNLIYEVCQHPAQTRERQKALHLLLLSVQTLLGILKSTHQDYPLALNKTWEWVCRNICTFEPRSSSLQESLVKWINSYLRYRIKDLVLPDNSNVISLDQPFRSDDDGNQVTLGESLPDPQSRNLDLLERKIAALQEKKFQRLGERVREHILSDEEGTLTACHLRKSPECHCQLLAARLLLQQPPDKIADIAREFNISNQTLYTHWKKKCLPLLQNIAIIYGYQL